MDTGDNMVAERGATTRDIAPPDVRSKLAARIHWLDGVRCCAALYVLLHHVFLSSFVGFPRNTGPWYLGWLVYGHLGVVVFIVVSGYSLSLAPVRNGHRLVGGVRRFARGRAWRILPPYWVALVLSMAIVHWITAPLNGHDVTVKSLVVHGLLLQDIVGSPVPNGTFWSIAVEAQIYVAFPVLLWVNRRYSAAVTVAVTTLLVSLSYELAVHVPAFAKVNHLNQQLLVGFVMGMLAADLSTRSSVQRHGRAVLQLAAALTLLTAIAFSVAGSSRVVAAYFWIDMVVAAIAAIALCGMTVRPDAVLPRLLAAKPFRFVGEYSYSIYLIHGPILLAIDLRIMQYLGLTPLEEFVAYLVAAVPVLLWLSHGFFWFFERPFLTVRSFAALRRYSMGWRSWRAVPENA